jgi:GNAT superfamily N-acetyltransferase
MITIRPMTAGDIPLGIRLKDQAGWNQIAADWQRWLELEPAGCLVAEWDGQPAGTTVVTVFGAVAWIAMVLVDEALRGRGIGTRLVEHALAHLEARRIASVRLDATPLGRPLYERLGFSADYELARWEGVAALAAAPAAADMATEADLAAISDLDRQIAGADRARLLTCLQRQNPSRLWRVGPPQRLLGYAASRTGSRAVQIGPAGALEPAAGERLLATAAAHAAGQRIFLDIPAINGPATAWAQAQGLAVQRRLTRMTRGPRVADQPALLWASSGPENG